MKITADAFRWVADPTGEWLCIKCSRPERIIQSLKPLKRYDVELKEHRERRSLDQNAYLWLLLDKLAEELSINGPTVSKVDVYRRLIPDVPGVSEIVCVQDKAVEKLCKGWEHNGLGWIAETVPSKIEGCTNVILYYGSSTYDTKQMTRMLNLVIEECKENGIETLTPEQLARMEETK